MSTNGPDTVRFTLDGQTYELSRSTVEV